MLSSSIKSRGMVGGIACAVQIHGLRLLHIVLIGCWTSQARTPEDDNFDATDILFKIRKTPCKRIIATDFSLLVSCIRSCEKTTYQR